MAEQHIFLGRHEHRRPGQRLRRPIQALTIVTDRVVYRQRGPETAEIHHHPVLDILGRRPVQRIQPADIARQPWEPGELITEPYPGAGEMRAERIWRKKLEITRKNLLVFGARVKWNSIQHQPGHQFRPPRGQLQRNRRAGMRAEHWAWRQAERLHSRSRCCGYIAHANGISRQRVRIAEAGHVESKTGKIWRGRLHFAQQHLGTRRRSMQHDHGRTDTETPVVHTPSPNVNEATLDLLHGKMPLQHPRFFV